VEKSKGPFVRQIARKIFLEDWPLKLLALVITLALWLGVTGLSTPGTRRYSGVPLNLNVSSSAQITNSPQQDVEIEVTGEKSRIEQINRAELTASLDLAELPPGERVVALSPKNVFVSLPQGVTVTDVVPRRIAVNLEAVEEKEIEVKVDTRGTLPAGFEIYNVNVVPARISVRGPASIVRMLEYVQTAPIDVAGKKEDFNGRQIEVTSPNPQAVVLNTFVDVFFRIGEKRVERLFSVPVTGEPETTATFILFGPRSFLQKRRSDEFRVDSYLDGEGQVKPRLTLPADLQDKVEVIDLKVNSK